MLLTYLLTYLSPQESGLHTGARVNFVLLTYLLSNQPMYVYSNLQLVLCTAARLVMKRPGYASVTEVMKKDLHWLGFPQQISYKLCTLTYKCLHGMAPKYLTRHFTPVSSVDGRSHLRSATAGHLDVPTTKTKTIGTKVSIIWHL